MMIFDKKKAISTIMDRRRGKDGQTSGAPMVPSEIKSEEGIADPRHEAAKDILSALSEGHPGKLMEAMSAFHDLHKISTESAS